jgi:hypothetical protein
MLTITRQELTESGVTAEIALSWADWYRAVASDTPANPSARGRAELMDYIAELLSGEQS